MHQLGWVLRLSVALVLLAAAVGKARSGKVAITDLAQTVRRLGLPGPLAAPVAAAASVAEAVVAVLLCPPATALAGCTSALVLCCMFSAGVARLVAASTGDTCRCFGAASPLGRHHVVRNLGLVGLAGAATVVTVAAPAAGGPVPLLLAVAAAPAVLVATAFIRWDDLVVLAVGLPTPADDKKGT